MIRAALWSIGQIRAMTFGILLRFGELAGLALLEPLAAG
jgi:hypothetical protein